MIQQYAEVLVDSISEEAEGVTFALHAFEQCRDPRIG